MSILGTRVLRTEDPKFLTTGGTYVEDLVLPGAGSVVYVRSTMAHALLTRVDISAALGAPGVWDVITVGDVELAPLPPEVPGLHPAMVRPWLADGVVRFVGEPICAVVAETRAQAVDAAELVEVDYSPLPAVVSPEDSLAGEVLLWPDGETNRAWVAGPDAVGGSLEDCEVVVRQRVLNQRVAPCPLEVQACAAAWSSDGSGVTFWMSTQSAHLIRDALAKALGLERSAVRVIAPDVGGGFGAKASPWPEALLVAWLARRVGRPLHWVETRSESMVALGHGRGQVQDIEIAGTRAGRVQGYRLSVLADAGAYPGIGAFLPALTKVMLSGVYDIERVGFEAVSVVTNTTPVTAYRGAGRPEAAAAIERAMDCFAAEIGMDPVELRRRNLIPSDAFPFRTPTGTVYDSGDYQRALDLVCEAADYSGLRAEQSRRREAGGPLAMGIGVSVYVEITNGLPDGELGTVEVLASGSVRVCTGTSPHGQGHHTAWAMLVADTLGVSVSDVEVRHGDTAEVARGVGTFASRSLQTGGVAVRQAASAVVERGRRLAAQLLEADAADVVLEEGRFYVAGSPGAPGPPLTWARLAEVATSQGGMAGADGSGAADGPEDRSGAADGSGPRDGSGPAVAVGGGTTLVSLPAGRLAAEVDYTPPGATFPFGAHLVVVEVDTETGKVWVRRIVAVDDAGRIVAPVLAEGQVHGGIAQGVAQAMMEEVRYDPDGNPLTANLADYCFASAAELPSFELIHMETPTPLNELGAKGIGESGSIGSTPAVQNAVVDALAHLGVRHVDMPTTPERIWRALGAGRSGQEVGS
ncbi:MAG: xanthine dehydrogenase family protein molybdopterin-binding subunit [Acidimicrobiales bacterium]